MNRRKFTIPKIVVYLKRLFISIIGDVYCLINLDLRRRLISESFQQYIEIGNQGWHTDSSLSFKYKISNPKLTYNTNLKIRHTTNYPYQNLFLFTSFLKQNTIIKKDTVEIFLCDKKGAWLGSGVGGMREVNKTLNHNIIDSGLHEIRIEQAMRYKEKRNIKYLLEISSVGIILEKQK